ncbi:MAG: glycosyltransferase [Kiritimatiellae bacterium]|nr:glycosyltransferase [Kiritimatiellia bacterium]
MPNSSSLPREELQRILMIRHSFAHHSKLGGSGVLCDYLPGTEMNAGRWPFGNATEGSRAWKIGRRIFDAGIIARANAYKLIHFIHAEFHPRATFRLLSALSPRTRLLATIHLPLDYYSLENTLRAYRHLHGIIALAKWQADQVRELLPHVHAWWVPCGFDMSHAYRSSAHLLDNTYRIVTIGSNYRDWPMTEAILDRAAAQFPAWRFHFVGIPARQRDSYRDRPNVVIEPRLSEPDYFKLIARCQTLLLPLTFATNNTAVLEAYSVGTPTLCSDLPAIHDYAISTTRTFRTADEAMATLVERATWNNEQRDATRQTTHREGCKFDWRNVAQRVSSVYQELLHGH